MAPPIGLAGSELALQQGLAGASGALAGGTAQARQDISQFGQGGLQALGTGIDSALSQLMQGQQAVTGGVSAGQQLLTQGGQQAAGQINQGVSGLDPFAQAGQQALGLQGALSGLGGQQAFDQALINSPAQRFLQEQGERAVTRNAAATGGLGGGNVLRELTRFGQGLASTDLQNQIGNLAGLSSQGLSAASNIGQLRGQGAGIASNLGAQGANLQQFGAGQAANLFGQGAGISATGGQVGANLLQNTGQNLGNLAQSGGINQANLITGAGQNIAQGRLGTGSAISNLLSQQGGGASDIIGGSATNIANLLSGFGGQQAGSQEQLAQLLANLAVQQSGQSTGLPSSAQFLNNQGILGGLGQVAGGAGGALSGLAAAGIIGSDKRLKKNIKKIGELSNGLNFYTWEWRDIASVIDGAKFTFGVLAQEVLDIMPAAVVVDKSGYLKVNYGMVLNG